MTLGSFAFAICNCDKNKAMTDTIDSLNTEIFKSSFFVVWEMNPLRDQMICQ